MQQIVVAYEGRMALINDVLGAIFPSNKKKMKSLIDAHDPAMASAFMDSLVAETNQRLGIETADDE
jgi:hypothetical protein